MIRFANYDLITLQFVFRTDILNKILISVKNFEVEEL